ncbi:hypothetical protein [Pleomorphomonas oryzae]|uniref:hypothetical protein n=1 Tax=Pleomorphomonas oryzae TaxID=261934 RepID=UPI0003F9488A|nr:hypothetical protein [Pleomorphomonas oryzae]
MTTKYIRITQEGVTFDLSPEALEAILKEQGFRLIQSDRLLFVKYESGVPFTDVAFRKKADQDKIEADNVAAIAENIGYQLLNVGAITITREDKKVTFAAPALRQWTGTLVFVSPNARPADSEVN